MKPGRNDRMTNEMNDNQDSNNSQPSPLHSNSAQSATKAESEGDMADGLANVDVQRQLAELNAALVEYKDKYVRALAEMENLRRRHEKERADLLKYGAEKLIKDMIPVIESFDKALPEEAAAASADAGNQNLQHDNEYEAMFRQGIKLVKRQFLDALAAQGLEQVIAKDAPFDPNVHQAIQKFESDQIDREMVKDEYAKGYLLNGRLVRPAMVSVLVPK